MSDKLIPLLSIIVLAAHLSKCLRRLLVESCYCIHFGFSLVAYMDHSLWKLLVAVVSKKQYIPLARREPFIKQWLYMNAIYKHL